jgi:4-amino-4-deoxy-L-arabinose transferase-like glycosyltransferase
MRLQRYLSWFIGIVIIAWAVQSPYFRGLDGSLKGTICLPIAIGLGLLIVGWGSVGNQKYFSMWLALALIGQAASLQLIDAGATIHWQHFKTPAQMVMPENFPALTVVICQLLFVTLGIRNRWTAISEWVGDHFKPWQIWAVALFIFLASSAVQRNVSLYLADFLSAVIIVLVNLGNIVLVAWSIPENLLANFQKKWNVVFGSVNPGEKAGKVDRFAMLGAIWVAAISALLGYFSYQWFPHITDEVAYLYQARFLASGAITLPAPPVPQAFDIYLMEIIGNQWWPATPPGWPAVLAIGVRFGVPGLVNPILAGINVLLVYLLVDELYDRYTARIAVFLLSFSPWYIFMGMNFMTHMITLTFALVAAVAVTRARRSEKAWWGFIAGAAVGAGSLVRPLDGLIVAICIGLWIIGIGGKRLSLYSIILFGIGTIMVGALVFPYNQFITGNPLTFPLNAYLDRHFGPGRNSLGFGPNKGFGWPVQPFSGHSPLGAMINSNLNAFSIEIELFGWGIGSLLFVALLIVSGSLRKSDLLLLFVCVANYAPYFFYYYSGGPDFGARYWFLMLVPLVALSVRGIQSVQKKLESSAAEFHMLGNRLMAAVFILVAFTMINYFPWRAIDKYYHYWGMRPDILTLSEKYHFGNGLVLIRGNDSHPDYTSAAIYNPLKWDANAPIYAWDRNPQVESQLLDAFKDRPVWVVDAPSITKVGYQVVSGPLSAQALKPEENSSVQNPN